jgi:hypothetical protein
VPLVGAITPPDGGADLIPPDANEGDEISASGLSGIEQRWRGDKCLPLDWASPSV